MGTGVGQVVGSSSSRWEGGCYRKKEGLLNDVTPKARYQLLYTEGEQVAKGSQCGPQVESNICDQNIRAPGQREINQETSLTHKASRF